MNNTGADVAISTLGKLIDQELAAVRAASRDGNRPFYEISSTRYHAYLTAKDEITKALAACVPERGRDIHLREQWHRFGAIRGQPAQARQHRAHQPRLPAHRHGRQGHPMSDTSDRIRAVIQCVTGLPADPTKENKQ